MEFFIISCFRSRYTYKKHNTPSWNLTTVFQKIKTADQRCSVEAGGVMWLKIVYTFLFFVLQVQKYLFHGHISYLLTSRTKIVIHRRFNLSLYYYLWLMSHGVRTCDDTIPITLQYCGLKRFSLNQWTHILVQRLNGLQGAPPWSWNTDTGRAKPGLRFTFGGNSDDVCAHNEL